MKPRIGSWSRFAVLLETSRRLNGLVLRTAHCSMGLREFDADLQEHIHLENDVLFPRSIQMEAALRGK